ncbi:hypothetical protein PoB_002238700 [Plakobranchus ocellatus]|uniref:Uncharacterized protein n=1 Tax=Plakobranchus ocellatus TaxID=259542 RepID=A0AAV3ZKU3_9GAST|nr:hypothetical protein PoB_002238700 [Plakobranchus ocellatus]
MSSLISLYVLHHFSRPNQIKSGFLGDGCVTLGDAPEIRSHAVKFLRISALPLVPPREVSRKSNMVSPACDSETVCEVPARTIKSPSTSTPSPHPPTHPKHTHTHTHTRKKSQAPQYPSAPLYPQVYKKKKNNS